MKTEKEKKELQKPENVKKRIKSVLNGFKSLTFLIAFIIFTIAVFLHDAFGYLNGTLEGRVVTVVIYSFFGTAFLKLGDIIE